MKFMALCILLLASGRLHANPVLLLTCQERFSGLDRFEIWAEKEKVYGLQFGTMAGKSYSARFSVDKRFWDLKKSIVLPEWYGYQRRLAQGKDDRWYIDYSDESTEGTVETTCSP